MNNQNENAQPITQEDQVIESSTTQSFTDLTVDQETEVNIKGGGSTVKAGWDVAANKKI